MVGEYDTAAPPEPRSWSPLEDRVLDATKACLERWGFDKVTVDDIATESGVSRATLYRLFPGGRDVLFEALRVREIEVFFTELRAAISATDDLHELLVEVVVSATRSLRDDRHLAAVLAAEPGHAVTQLTVEGLPRIVRMASAFLLPLVTIHLDGRRAAVLIDLLARMVISYFLAPSETVDLGDEASARRFLAPLIDAIEARDLRSTTGET